MQLEAKSVVDGHGQGDAVVAKEVEVTTDALASETAQNSGKDGAGAVEDVADGHDEAKALYHLDHVRIAGVAVGHGGAEAVDTDAVNEADDEGRRDGGNDGGVGGAGVLGANVGRDAGGDGNAERKGHLVKERHGGADNALGGKRDGAKAGAENGEGLVGEKLCLDHDYTGNGETDENGPVGEEAGNLGLDPALVAIDKANV